MKNFKALHCAFSWSEFVYSELPQAFLADPLGVAAVVLTSDDKVVIQQRSHWVAEGAGQLDVPGGHPEPSVRGFVFKRL